MVERHDSNTSVWKEVVAILLYFFSLFHFFQEGIFRYPKIGDGFVRDFLFCLEISLGMMCERASHWTFRNHIGDAAS